MQSFHKQSVLYSVEDSKIENGLIFYYLLLKLTQGCGSDRENQPPKNQHGLLTLCNEKALMSSNHFVVPRPS